MVIDTSALIALLCDEAEAEAMEAAILADRIRYLCAASLLETSIVIEARNGPSGGRELDLLLYKAGIEIIAVDEQQAGVARHAYRTYGKGVHPAALNFGDCFSYALARVTGEPLLFKGNDFSETDVERVKLTPPDGSSQPSAR
jgi:ribonuclease VapC